jgi:hypothetical protein
MISYRSRDFSRISTGGNKDSSGYITKEELEQALKNHGIWQTSRSLSQGPFNIKKLFLPMLKLL